LNDHGLDLFQINRVSIENPLGRRIMSGRQHDDNYSNRYYHAAAEQNGWDRDERLEETSKALGHVVESSTELTDEERIAVAEAFNEYRGPY